MLTFPNSKINLGLSVKNKRPDGFHNIESVFYPIALSDALEAIEEEKSTLTLSGQEVSGDLNDNLVWKAFSLLKENGLNNNVHLHLHKVIPSGAGLGGGSSDGSFTLKLLNEKFKLDYSDEDLIKMAGDLGSDCPFFIRNIPSLCSGTGDIFSDVKLSLKGKFLVVIHPKIFVSTKEAFQNLELSEAKKPIKKVIEQPIITWKEELINDFEDSIFRLYPKIKKVKDFMYKNGAVYASMTGTGSAVYGIFDFPTNFFDKDIVFQGEFQ